MKPVRYPPNPALRAALAALALIMYGGTAAAQSVTLPDVHGLAFGADGKRLIVAVHDGLAIYNAGRWSKDTGPRHDYMGFTATKGRFYSSGHPAPGSGLKNPVGLIVSGDGGRTWEKRGLEGEADFHVLGASWNTNGVYAWNSGRNSRMPSPGLYFTLNDGLMWRSAAAKGLSGTPRAIAVHPGDAEIVAVATSTGVYLSRNDGDSFEPVARKGEGLTVFFDLDGKRLWHSIYDGGPRLARTALRGGGDISIALPPLTNDAVAYVAQNPAKPTEYAIATFERSVYVSEDSGQTWRQIARNGKGL